MNTTPTTETNTTKTPWYKKKKIVIPIGIIVAIGIGANLGGTDTTTTKPAATVTQNAQLKAESAKPVDNTARIGQPVRDGQFEFVVSKPICGKKTVGSEYLNAKAQGQFCVIPMTVKNIGDKGQTFNASDQKAFIGEASYDADTMASMYAETSANGKSSSFLENINPGNSVKGSIVFDVPKGKTPDRVELHDSAFSGGETVELR